MGWPKTLKIDVRDEATGRIVKNAVVFLVIVAERKNNLSLGPYVTNQDGELKIVRGEVINEVETALRAFPMDYAIDLDKDAFEIVVEVESRDSLRKRYQNVRNFFPEAAEVMRARLEGDVAFASSQVRRPYLVSEATSTLRCEVPLV